MLGQAERIIELNGLTKPLNNSAFTPKIVAVTSGKGGTGKSYLAANLGLSMAAKGYRVLLVDMDINLSNQNVLFNMSIKKTIYHFLLYNQCLSDIIHESSINPNLSVIFGESGKLDHPSLTEEKVNNLFFELRRLSQHFDIILLDTASGIENGTLQLLLNSDEIILITTPEPTSVMDGYAINKLLKNHGSNTEVNVIVNKCFEENEAVEAFENLQKATEHFLKKEIQFLGGISFSEEIIRSIQSQTLIVNSPKLDKIHRQIDKISSKLKIPTFG